MNSKRVLTFLRYLSILILTYIMRGWFSLAFQAKDYSSNTMRHFFINEPFLCCRLVCMYWAVKSWRKVDELVSISPTVKDRSVIDKLFIWQCHTTQKAMPDHFDWGFTLHRWKRITAVKAFILRTDTLAKLLRYVSI